MPRNSMELYQHRYENKTKLSKKCETRKSKLNAILFCEMSGVRAAQFGCASAKQSLSSVELGQAMGAENATPRLRFKNVSISVVKCTTLLSQFSANC